MSKKPLRHTGEKDTFFDVEEVASGTECTGLMPTMVYTEDEAENLSQLEGIHPIKPQGKKK